MNPQQITMIYSLTTFGKRTFVNYALSSPNGDSTHSGVLRKGNEDYYALSLLLNSRSNQRFDLTTCGIVLPVDKLEALDEIVRMHNASVPNSRKR
jgi:hypothetical protein